MEVTEAIPSSKHRRKRKTSNSNGTRLKKHKGEESSKRLEKLVIGDCSSIIQNMARMLDNDSGLEDEFNEFDSESQFSDTLASPPRQPAWEDDDDDLNLTTRQVSRRRRIRNNPVEDVMSENYQESLRKRFRSVFGDPIWARLNKNKASSSDDEDDIVRTCGNLLRKSTGLPKSVLDVKPLASLNCQTINEGPVIKAVEFHPKSTVALVAGLSGVASILQVDGQVNAKLSSIHFDRFPIRCAKFTVEGNKVVIGSNVHSHFHVYDMMEGKSIRISVHHNMELTSMKSFVISPDGNLIAALGRFGQIHLITTSSFEWVDVLQANGNATALAFSPDGSTLYSHGESGEIYMWDMNRRTCRGRIWDEGCLAGTSLAVSPDNQYLAAGSSSGVVNIYSIPQLASNSTSTPRPLKALMNLTTSATFTTFNPTSQILAFGSDEKPNSVKMCHLGSMSVFSNFPSFNVELARVQCATFSPGSGFFSIGNNRSTAFLYRLKHFGNY